MAHYIPSAGIGHFTGALSKKKDSPRLTTTRRKRIKDPLTGEVIGLGPREIYLQERRDLSAHPLSDKEKRARAHWSAVCRMAPAIIRDKSHPRYMEFYRRWREHVQATDRPMQFPNFVRHVLSQESG